ncbi:unnamed protein product [Gongylonema pulchrum]|uniref:SPOC domain-containing protein n=1 Tax=Gongylonema pulchrum TaxID=637853 RepID=A0A3P6RNA7_9BILA|nr:unnamed protein product [Gongylonema pulchrum]
MNKHCVIILSKRDRIYCSKSFGTPAAQETQSAIQERSRTENFETNVSEGTRDLAQKFDQPVEQLGLEKEADSSDSGRGKETQKKRQSTSPMSAMCTICPKRPLQLNERDPTAKCYILLKNMTCSVSLYDIAGNIHLLYELYQQQFMPRILIKEVISLAKVATWEKEMLDHCRGKLCLLIGKGDAQFGPPVVDYLRKREVAGHIKLTNFLLLIFAPCDLACRLVQTYAPNLTSFTPDCDDLLFAMFKSAV